MAAVGKGGGGGAGEAGRRGEDGGEGWGGGRGGDMLVEETRPHIASGKRTETLPEALKVVPSLGQVIGDIVYYTKTGTTLGPETSNP